MKPPGAKISKGSYRMPGWRQEREAWHKRVGALASNADQLHKLGMSTRTYDLLLLSLPSPQGYNTYIYTGTPALELHDV